MPVHVHDIHELFRGIRSALMVVLRPVHSLVMFGVASTLLLANAGHGAGVDGGTLSVTSAGSTYRAPGSSVQVNVGVSGLSAAAVGVQVLVEWDSTELTYVSASGSGAFELIREPVLLPVPGSPTRQRLALATGLVEGGTGVTSGTLGSISFVVSPGALVCEPKSLVDFGPEGSVYSTRLSAAGGVPIAFVGVENVVFGTDAVAPVLAGVPESVVLSPGTTTSPELDAFLAAVVTAQDACGAAVLREVTLPDESTSSDFPSVFPEGVTTVRWTATDGSSNSVTTTRTVNAEPCPGIFVTYYLDNDGDGFGQSASSVVTCVGVPSGYAAADGDCDDSSDAAYPGAPELCATVGVDNDCDGSVDDIDANAADKVQYYSDSDGDGYTLSTGALFCPGTTNAGYLASPSSPVDCDDSSDAAYPGAPELCATVGVDNDCDGSTADVDADAADKVLFYSDGDGDGYTLSTGALFCPGTTNAGYLASPSSPVDCDDSSDAAYPGAVELCATVGVDNDCDGDAYEATDRSTWYSDSDGDGVGDAYVTQLSCAQPSGYVALAGDACPSDPGKLAPGICGCGVSDADTDGDTVPDCIDNCPQSPNESQADCDGDGTGDACSAIGDCNGNGIPDNCDISSGQSNDVDANGVPDSCQQDCNSNGVPDSYEIATTPSLDFDGSGQLDACEGRTFWIGGSTGVLADASNWSSGLPEGPVTAVFDTGGAVTVTSPGGTLTMRVVVRSGAVRIMASSPLTLSSLSVEEASSLSISGRLSVLGDATVLSTARLELTYGGWLSVDGRMDCRQQSTLMLELRITDEPFIGAGSGSFLGGVDVRLGSVSAWTVEAGTRFVLVETESLESDGFFASLYAPGFGPNLLAVVGPEGTPPDAERLEVEVVSQTELLQPTESGSASVTGTPTALEVAALTGDEFEDVAVTVSFGSDEDGLLYVLRSDGSGSFDGQASYPTDRDPRGVRAGRFDETDQTTDLAVVCAGSATVRAYRNLSQTVNGFVPGPATATVADPRALASVTPDPAGTPLLVGTDSLVVAGFGSNSLQGLSSGGDGVLVPGTVIQLGRRPGGVSTVPGSSRPDKGVTAALGAAVDGGQGEVVTLSVQPGGVLVQTGSALGPSRPTDIESRDLDGDGLPDVVVTAESGSVSVLRGTESGLSFSGSFAVGALPARDGALGDFDGDGRPDIAVASIEGDGSTGSRVSLFLNESVPGGVPTFRPAGSFAEGAGVRLVESGRLTSDAGDGLATVSEEVSDTSLAGEPTGLVTVVRFTTPEFAVCLADLNGDRVVDGTDLCMLLALWDLPGLGDLNGDGLTDGVDLAILLTRWGPCDA